MPLFKQEGITMNEDFDRLKADVAKRHAEVVLMLQEMVERAQMTHPHFDSGPGAALRDSAEEMIRRVHPWKRVGPCPICGHNGTDCTGWGGIS